MVCPYMSTITNYNVYHTTCWSGGLRCVFTSRSECPPHQTGPSEGPPRFCSSSSGTCRYLVAPVISVNVIHWSERKKKPPTGLLESQRIDNRTVSESWFLQKTSSSDRAAIKARSLEKKSPSHVWFVSPQGPSAASFLWTKAQAGSEVKPSVSWLLLLVGHWWWLVWIQPAPMYTLKRLLQMPTPAPIRKNIFMEKIFFLLQLQQCFFFPH